MCTEEREHVSRTNTLIYSTLIFSWYTALPRALPVLMTSDERQCGWRSANLFLAPCVAVGRLIFLIGYRNSVQNIIEFSDSFDKVLLSKLNRNVFM